MVTTGTTNNASSAWPIKKRTKIVKFMFERYAQGYGASSIAKL